MVGWKVYERQYKVSPAETESTKPEMKFDDVGVVSWGQKRGTYPCSGWVDEHVKFNTLCQVC